MKRMLDRSQALFLILPLFGYVLHLRPNRYWFLFTVLRISSLPRAFPFRFMLLRLSSEFLDYSSSKALLLISHRTLLHLISGCMPRWQRVLLVRRSFLYPSSAPHSLQTSSLLLRTYWAIDRKASTVCMLISLHQVLHQKVSKRFHWPSPNPLK